MYTDRKVTDDGVEATFAINHLSVFLLSTLLLDLLKASGPARIITIASEIHRKGKIHFDDLGLESDYTVNKALAQSKLANILFTRALARRIAGSGVSAFAVHPGHVKTDFTRDLRGFFGIFVRIIRRRFLTPSQGAKTGVYLATTPDLDDANGGYFSDCKQIEPSDVTADAAVADRLWAISEDMVRKVAEPKPATGGRQS